MFGQKQSEDTPEEKPDENVSQLTKAEAAKLVKRSVPKVVDGKLVLDKHDKPVMKQVPVKEDEVLDFKEYVNHVVVVTKDGQKLTGAKS